MSTEDHGEPVVPTDNPSEPVAPTDDAGEPVVPAEDPGELVVRVDRGRCVSSGQCVLTAPDQMELGADSQARPRTPTAAADARARLAEAAELCPTEAITVRLARTGELIAPAEPAEPAGPAEPSGPAGPAEPAEPAAGRPDG
ncbi:ferredoxin [Streptomyces sp. XD-27]|uniref:ferredoxin n=1 Tax=Streptomyces sp. XD-27 TaxID=3062779 RepID=UPI0026F41191|nr:ferredoxin [Streptomyces sp. XD-27]WKX70543.1 ferredoxin [Streptomyces sp. XD-27]